MLNPSKEGETTIIDVVGKYIGDEAGHKDIKSTIEHQIRMSY